MRRPRPGHRSVVDAPWSVAVRSLRWGRYFGGRSFLSLSTHRWPPVDPIVRSSDQVPTAVPSLSRAMPRQWWLCLALLLTLSASGEFSFHFLLPTDHLIGSRRRVAFRFERGAGPVIHQPATLMALSSCQLELIGHVDDSAHPSGQTAVKPPTGRPRAAPSGRQSETQPTATERQSRQRESDRRKSGASRPAAGRPSVTALPKSSTAKSNCATGRTCCPIRSADGSFRSNLHEY
jgi:hypothetical protein